MRSKGFLVLVEPGQMRIAFLLNVFPKTSETFILNQIIGLIERGHTVDIFAREPNIDAVHPDGKKHKLIERTRYLTITKGRKKRLLAGAKIILRRDWGRLSHLLRSTNTFRS